MSLQAFVARRVITPDGIRPAAILVKGEQIEAVVSPDQVPGEGYKIHDFGGAAILPGLIDSHVHINDPGRAEWEGFETATRAAAAGGYTLLVDMPLNCLPATTNVAALEAKRAAAQGRCRVDWAAWGGVVHDNRYDQPCLTSPGLDCRFWYTRNFPVQLIWQRTLWRVQTGAVIQPTFNRGPTKRNWLRSS